MINLAMLLPWLTDAVGAWKPLPPGVAPNDEERCRANDLENPDKPGTPPRSYPVVDLESKAASAVYENGKNKRTRYPVVDLSQRIVLIGLHQAGTERTESRWEDSAHRVTCHRAIGPTGNRYRVHQLNRRLVCTNRVDRAPYHCVGIEVLGNFRGSPGGRHYKPEVFGRGELGSAQLAALREEIDTVIDEVDGLGGVVVGILPHRTTGRNSRGVPNRQICCGFEVWSGAGEWAGAERGLRVPGPEWSLGGLPIPAEWHGEHWPRCVRRFDG